MQPENTLNDSAVEQNGAVPYPTEFLNTLEPSRTSSHRVILKMRSPIMILRSLDPPLDLQWNKGSSQSNKGNGQVTYAKQLWNSDCHWAQKR